MDAAADTLYTALWLRDYTKSGWMLHANLNRVCGYYLPDITKAQRTKVISILIKRGHFLSRKPTPATHPHYLFVPEPITDATAVREANDYWRWNKHWSEGWKPDWRAHSSSSSVQDPEVEPLSSLAVSQPSSSEFGT
jgi:hypothetical protein